MLIELCRAVAAERGVAPASLPREEGAWTEFASAAERNRLAPLAYARLKPLAENAGVPEAVLRSLRNAYGRALRSAELYQAELLRLLDLFGAASVPVVVLRGPGSGLRLYGDPALRPFTDLDLLTPRPGLAAAEKCLEAAGYAPLDARLPPAYFARYHLHIAYRHPAAGMMVELHHAVDHRYTPFLVDYAAVFRDAGGDGIPLPSRVHTFLLDAVHLVKHAVALPYTTRADDALQQIAAEDCLILLLDLALQLPAVRPQWPAVRQTAEKWNVERELAAVLPPLAMLVDNAPAAPAVRPSATERALFRAVTALAPALRRGRPVGLFRPVRALDLWRYAFPGRRRLRATYRLPLVVSAPLHPLRAIAGVRVNARAYRRHNPRRG